MSDNTVSSYKGAQFTGNNFPVWQADTTASLLGEDCWEPVAIGDVVLYAVKHPDEIADGKVVKSSWIEERKQTVVMLECAKPMEHKAVTAHRTKMRAAYNIIIKSLKPQFKAAVTNMKNPKEIWDYMQSTYNKKTAINKVLIISEFFRSVMNEGTPLKSHLAWFEQKIGELVEIGFDFSDEIHAIIFLLSLPHTFSMCRAALESTHTSTTFKFDEVKTAALQDEIRRKGSNEAYVERALRTAGRQTPRHDKKNNDKDKDKNSSKPPVSPPPHRSSSRSRHRSSSPPHHHHHHQHHHSPSTRRPSPPPSHSPSSSPSHSRSSSPTVRWCESCRKDNHDTDACFKTHPELAVDYYKKMARTYRTIVEQGAPFSTKEERILSARTRHTRHTHFSPSPPRQREYDVDLVLPSRLY